MDRSSKNKKKQMLDKRITANTSVTRGTYHRPTHPFQLPNRSNTKKAHLLTKNIEKRKKSLEERASTQKKIRQKG